VLPVLVGLPVEGDAPDSSIYDGGYEGPGVFLLPLKHLLLSYCYPLNISSEKLATVMTKHSEKNQLSAQASNSDNSPSPSTLNSNKNYLSSWCANRLCLLFFL